MAWLQVNNQPAKVNENARLGCTGHWSPLFSSGFARFGARGIPRNGFDDLFASGAIWLISSPKSFLAQVILLSVSCFSPGWITGW